MQGLEMLTKRGILVKVNSVLIPGINDAHLPLVNAEVTRRGAFLHNIMPLISDAAHGTHFGLTGQRGPTHAELEAVQAECGGGAKLMRHCRQCRADAVGLLGEDRGQQFTLDKIADTVAYDGSKREAYRDVVAREREDREAAKKAAAADLEAAAAATRLTVAVATRGGGRVNQHFGHAREFQIYRASPEGIAFAGVRRLEDSYCKDGDGEDKTLDAAIKALDGVDMVLVAKIGDCPRRKLEAAGLKVSDTYAHDYIETAISAYYAEAFGAAPRALSA
jgi:nitrogen fixation protein NifB